LPVQPEWLQGRALAAWNSVVVELTAIGVTSRLDAGILASWASAMGTLAEAQELLNTMDSGRRLLIQNKRGGPSVNPLLGIIRKASRDAVHYATLLGLTPSARATLEVKPQPNDPMDKYFGSKS
jgi:P27 family predicted phage terminase small subunit